MKLGMFTFNEGKVVMVRYTEDLNKLWKCEMLRRDYPDQVGQPLHFSGEPIRIYSNPLPRFHRGFCRESCNAERIWLRADETDPYGDPSIWICEHQIDADWDEGSPSIRNFFRDRRSFLGISQAELAKSAGLSTDKVASWEGAREKISGDELEQIATVLSAAMDLRRARNKTRELGLKESA